MKILVIGSGGREHALAWKFAQSDNVDKVFVAPGNGGTAMEAKCVNVPMKEDTASFEGQKYLKEFAKRERIELTMVGPELPLATGIVDIFRAAGLRIIGPTRQAALLETSKVYSKAFMEKYGVRTAWAHSFTNPKLARSYAAEYFGKTAVPLVVKADGLAAGKGVIIAQNFAEAEMALDSFMRDKILGSAGTSLLLEEFLEGTEVSVMAAVSVVGKQGYIKEFISARDHKRRFDRGKGPNTGGMGAIAPVPDFPSDHLYEGGSSNTITVPLVKDFVESIVDPTLKGMLAEGFDYRGFIFFGLMVQNDRCYLLEYNVRLGDPETQALLPLLDSDLASLCFAILTWQDPPIIWKKGAVCAPVIVADGYPGPYQKNDPITINKAALEKSGARVFVSGATSNFAEGHSGNGASDKILRTSGGRVLTVSAFGTNADEAYAAAYRGLEAVSFKGMDFRRDIGREEISLR